MKCPKCGSYNKSEYNKCYVCGATLPKEFVQKNEDSNDLWTKKAFRTNSETNTKNIRDNSRASVNVNLETGQVSANDSMPSSPSRKLRQNYSIETKRALARERGVWDGGKTSSSHQIRRDDDNVPIVALDDETGNDKVKPARARRGSRRKRKDLSANAKKIQKFTQGTEVAVVVPAETYKEPKKVPYEAQPRTKYKKNVNIKWGRLVFVCFLGAAIIFGIIIGVTSLIQAISSNFSQIFSPRNELPNGGQPLVERVLIDGQTWHTITFYGEDGDKILVEDESHDIKRTLTIHENKAVLKLDDYAYIPEPEEEYYRDPFTYVDLKAWHFNRDGAETELYVPVYRIAIDQAPLTVISPEQQSYTEDKTQIFVKVKVNLGSRVIIGSKNMTGNVDNQGYTSTYITLEPEGENIIPITVQADGYRENKYELLVNHPKQDIDLELIGAPTEERDDLITIDGKTEPGAVLSFSSSTGTILTNDLDVKANGTFTIRTQFTDFGENEIKLKATMPDGRSATITHIVHRLPYEGSYTRRAWPLDYKALTNSATKMIGQVYVLHGQILERIDTPGKRLYLFDAGVDGEQQHLIIEYNGLNDLKEDVVYDVYADVSGKYDNLPMLNARFIYVFEPEDDEGVANDDS